MERVMRWNFLLLNLFPYRSKKYPKINFDKSLSPETFLQNFFFKYYLTNTLLVSFPILLPWDGVHVCLRVASYLCLSAVFFQFFRNPALKFKVKESTTWLFHTQVYIEGIQLVLVQLFIQFVELIVTYFPIILFFSSSSWCWFNRSSEMLSSSSTSSYFLFAIIE